MNIVHSGNPKSTQNFRIRSILKDGCWLTIQQLDLKTDAGGYSERWVLAYYNQKDIVFSSNKLIIPTIESLRSWVS